LIVTRTCPSSETSLLEFLGSLVQIGNNFWIAVPDADVFLSDATICRALFLSPDRRCLSRKPLPLWLSTPWVEATALPLVHSRLNASFYGVTLVSPLITIIPVPKDPPPLLPSTQRLCKLQDPLIFKGASSVVSIAAVPRSDGFFQPNSTNPLFPLPMQSLPSPCKDLLPALSLVGLPTLLTLQPNFDAATPPSGLFSDCF